jgi:DNA-binding transcriptional ArsR family regulator
LELLPPRIRDRELLGLLGELLSPRMEPTSASALRLRLMREGFSWQALVDLARGQNVLLPLVFSLSMRGLLPPVPKSARNSDGSHVTLRLGEIYRQHLARRQLEQRQLGNVLAALNRAGIVPLILKGGRYLAEPCEPWCEARSIRDIDILVREGEADRAVEALRAEGYAPGSPYMPDYHHRPALDRADEPVPVEIHTDALAVAGQRIMSTEFAWANAAKTDDGRFFVMPPRWQALHCLLHHQASDHGYARQVLAVKALWEWAMLTRDFAREDWDSVAAPMRAAGAADLLGSWLVQSHRLFGVEIPAAVPVSPDARAHASAALDLATRPHWMRRVRFIADQLRFSFARETLAMRYGKPVARVSLADAGKHATELVRLHRGRWLRRLMGHPDLPS